jgi:transposase
MSGAPDKTPSDKLPDSLEACHEEIRGLREELAWLKAQLYGPRADRVGRPLPQPELFEEAIPTDEAPAEGESEETDQKKVPAKRKGHGRRDLKSLDHIPVRETIIHDVLDEEKFCTDCGMDRAPMATRVSYQLGYIPAQLYRIKHIYQQYVCDGGCEKPIVSPEPPLEIVQGGMASAQLIAQVAVGKFDDHLPLHRQQQIFARHGVDLPRTTMLGWLKTAARELGVLVESMAGVQKRAGFLGVDETPVAIQASGKTRKGYMWVVVGGEEAPYAVYHFEPGRSRAGPERFLAGFKGTLQSDNYAVYSALCAEWELRHAGCWAHVRRKFVDAYKVGKYTHARQAVEKIRELYRIEREFCELPSQERLAARRARSAEPVAEFFAWLKELQIKTPPASKLGRAISYALKCEAALKVFLEDGRVPLDNNAVERAIRPIAVGRKNWLFAGSEEGGRTAAVFYTLIESAKRHGLNVFEYLSDVMRRLPGLPRRSLSELLPDRWKAGQPTPVAAI